MDLSKLDFHLLEQHKYVFNVSIAPLTYVNQGRSGPWIPDVNPGQYQTHQK